MGTIVDIILGTDVIDGPLNIINRCSKMRAHLNGRKKLSERLGYI